MHLRGDCTFARDGSYIQYAHVQYYNNGTWSWGKHTSVHSVLTSLTMKRKAQIVPAQRPPRLCIIGGTCIEGGCIAPLQSSLAGGFRCRSVALLIAARGQEPIFLGACLTG